MPNETTAGETLVDCKPAVPAKTAFAAIHTAIVCPHCGKQVMLSGDYRGKIIFCQFEACRKQIVIA